MSNWVRLSGNIQQLCAPVSRRRAKYELKHVVRTHLAANDAAFNCVVEQEDKEGVRGVTLSKELMAIAGAVGYCRVHSILGRWQDTRRLETAGLLAVSPQTTSRAIYGLSPIRKHISLSVSGCSASGCPHSCAAPVVDL